MRAVGSPSSSKPARRADERGERSAFADRLELPKRLHLSSSSSSSTSSSSSSSSSSSPSPSASDASGPASSAPPGPSSSVPSGPLVVRFDAKVAREVAERARARTPSLAAHLEALTTPGLVRDLEGRVVDVSSLPLCDAHLLRAALLRAGVLVEEPERYTCEGCDEPLEVAPSTLLELGPFVDGELFDDELDAVVAPLVERPIPKTRLRSGVVDTVRLAPRTLAESAPLWQSASDASGPRLRGSALVTALGVVALGDERRATTIARALARPRLWDAVASHYLDLHYPRRLFGLARCERCGARNDLEVPALREVYPSTPGDEAGHQARAGREVPSLEAFEARVREVSPAIYRALGVRNVDLVVDDGPPHVDEGGELLLGSYLEGSLEGELGLPRAPEVRLYYRTFALEARRDPSFDLDAELCETIEHELTHHLHHLAGVDPVDDEERATIVRERERIVGSRETRRRATRGLVSELSGFVRATWPLWALAAAVSALTWCR